MFLLLPLCCVYYPVAVLPGWLQPVAWVLPPTYVFEGLRAVLGRPRVPRRPHGATRSPSTPALFAVGIAGLPVVPARRSRRAGTLLQMGE